MSSSIESEKDDNDTTKTIQESSIDSMVIEPLEEKKVLLPSSTIQIPESTVSQEKPIDKARIDDTPPSEKDTTATSVDDGKDSLISTSVVGEAIVQDSTTDTQLVSDSRLEEPFDETAFF